MQKIRRFLPTIVIFLIGVGLGIGGLHTYQFIKGPKQTVSVVGQGQVEALADQAIVNVQIINTSYNQLTAQEATKKDMLDLKNALLKLGIPTSQINENSYDSSPEVPMELNVDGTQSFRPPYPGISSNEYSSYADLNITLTTIVGIDKIFTTINAQKHAKVSYTDYSLKSSVKYEDGAREKALQNARAQVESIAKINNLRVGKLVSISNTNVGFGMMGDTKEMMVNSAPSAGTQVSYGEKTIPVNASFNAVYELY